jgi:ABC-type bacteriocin/lantibiotic exporter with double-glycine peptidase domain
MWRRWWRQPEVVLVADAGDDATAALTTILRFHDRSVSIAEVMQVLERDETGRSHAGHVVAAAEHFRLRAQGFFVEDERSLREVSTPNIAHMSMTPGSFPRPPGTVDDTYFSVVVAISESRVREIDPYRGRLNWARSDFLSHATGVFLTFDAASPLPRARLGQA